MTQFDCAGKILNLATPQVMGILNVTPDSFSDGGVFVAKDDALRQAEAMAKAGAAIIDVGGESTRPGAKAVGIQEELDRVIPVIEALAENIDLPISIDTSKAAVMTEAAAAGAGFINDVCALQQPEALAAAAATGLPVCLMHMQGEPRSMQQNPEYSDVVNDVSDFLAARVSACENAGIVRSKILLDPGFGFGKSLPHNLRLMKQLGHVGKGFPLLVGVSRKSMIHAISPSNVDQRLPGSLALAVLALEQGAKLLRVHDVAETVQALRVWQAVRDVE